MSLALDAVRVLVLHLANNSVAQRWLSPQTVVQIRWTITLIASLAVWSCRREAAFTSPIVQIVSKRTHEVVNSLHSLCTIQDQPDQLSDQLA